MGTRSLTMVREGKARLLAMYRHMDGYPTGHGQELVDFLAGLELVNGLGGLGQRRVANGMRCLAAQLVAHFKTGAGGFYLESPSRAKAGDEDYCYVLNTPRSRPDLLGPADGLDLAVYHWGKQVFRGTVAKFRHDLDAGRFN